MKITVVEPAARGGLIHYAFQLCRAMQNAGADVTLVTARDYELEGIAHPFKLERRLRLWDPKPSRDSLPRVFRPVRRATRAAIYYREWLRLGAFLRRTKPDVVQFGDIRFATDYAPLAMARRTTRIMADICHNVRPLSGSEGAFRERSLFKRIYGLFDTIFVHYDVNAREFARSFPESALKVVPIVHGNEEIFRELASPLPAARGEGSIVLFFGTLSRYKGLDLLLEAFVNVPDATLVVAGFPAPDFDVDAFRRDAERLGIADRLRLVARYIESSEVASWMELADVIVFPYREIFQSGALHVAQTFGVPIVATRVGAMAEVIRDRETGLVVEPDDVPALSAAIRELLSDRVLARRLGDAAARDAATKYSWRSVAETILTRYEHCLVKGGRR